MSLPPVLGQGALWENLRSRVLAGQLPHALLFIDRPNLAMGFPFARALATFMHCTAPTSEGACGHCTSCLQSSQYAHPDIRYIFPVLSEKKGQRTLPTSANFMNEWQLFTKENPYPTLPNWLRFLQSENRQGNISAQECAIINEEAQLSAQGKGGKIFILWLAEYLGQETNKLLKIIEEPYPNTFFFLITGSLHQLLPTLISRTQSFPLASLSPHTIRGYLRDIKGLSEEKIEEYILQADTDFPAILGLEKEAFSFLPLLRSFLNSCFSQKMKYIQEVLQALSAQSREEVKSFVSYAENIFATALRAHYHEGQTNEFALKIKERLNPAQLDAILSMISQYHYYITRNAELKLLFHSLILQCRQIQRTQEWIAL